MSESRCRIVQCLCPQRHCIVATTYDSARENPSVANALRAAVANAIRDGVINPKCELCGAAPDLWVYEDQTTRFKTQAEARPHLRAAERAQLAAQAFLKAGKN